ncbi:MAG: EamA family transporter [Phycisphaerales bacterium]|nr:EamA family transporter [Phycisphaerales bacterium]
MPSLLLAVLAGLCWGIGELFTKSVLHTKEVGPITAIMVRSTVALPVLWLVWWFTVSVLKTERADWWRAAETGTILKLTLGSGLIAGAAAMICFYAALSMGEISRIKPIAFTLAPATAVLLGWLVLGESMTTRKAIAVTMILAGVVLLTGSSKSHSPTETTPSTESTP